MNIRIQFLLNSNPVIKRYLRENSRFYKDIIRNPEFIKIMIEMMKKEYKLTVPDKLSKIKENITMVNSLMDVIK